ncbi:MAG TPA: hypothetical protein VFN19_11320 [Candidatus Nanopelagicales bacterium]|nr:hypothetical protein [Candidatus Nanopelagicales bacterium]
MGSLFVNIDFNTVGAVDNGTRPYTGPNPLWNNVSIFLDGGPSQTETRVGQATTVRVRVSNKGTTAVSDVDVDAYVMSPFVGLANPAQAIRRLHGFSGSIAPGSGTPAANDAHVVTCRIQDPVLGSIPWTPTTADLATTSGGHLCLIANVYADADGAAVPDAGTFDIANDPHQGQRNIHVLADMKGFGFIVFPASDGAPTAVDVVPLRAAVLNHPSERWALRSRADIGVKLGSGATRLWLSGRGEREAVPLTYSRKGIAGSIDLGDLGQADLTVLARSTERILRDGGSLAARGADWGRERLVVTVPAEGARGTLNLRRSDRRGSVQAFDVVQRDARGRALGGMRIISVQR